jgi:hypothetical protein
MCDDIVASYFIKDDLLRAIGSASDASIYLSVSGSDRRITAFRLTFGESPVGRLRLPAG